MRDEIASHKKVGTWDLVSASNLPKGSKVVGSTWSYKLKRNADGTISRYKARFCAQGFSQIDGLHYNQTYSNAISRDAFRFLLAYSAMMNLKLTGGDIKTAYLNGWIEKDLILLMKQPQGFEETGPDGDKLLCKLVRSIYGLKQSGARWEARLVEHLIGQGFERCQADQCLYKLQQGNDTLILAVYVDDLIFASSSDTLRESVMAKLRKDFEVSDTGPLTWVLGTAVKQDMEEGTITLSQKLYIEDVVHTFLTKEEATTIKKGTRVVPCNLEISSLSSLPEGEEPDPMYRRGVGMLAWLVAITRPDIAYAQSILSRFSSGGGAAHMETLKNVVRYLNKTKHYSITYQKDQSRDLMKLLTSHSKFRCEVLESDELVTFTDTSMGGAKPMAGEIHMYGGDPISWRGARLPHTPLSSCESEYLGASRAAVTALHLRQIETFLKSKKLTKPTVIFCDNLAAVMLSDSNTSSKRMKHVATRIAFLQELIEAKHIYLYHVGTKGQLADIFTKALLASVFHELRSIILA